MGTTGKRPSPGDNSNNQKKQRIRWCTRRWNGRQKELSRVSGTGSGAGQGVMLSRCQGGFIEKVIFKGYLLEVRLSDIGYGGGTPRFREVKGPEGGGHTISELQTCP